MGSDLSDGFMGSYQNKHARWDGAAFGGNVFLESDIIETTDVCLTRKSMF